MIMIKPVSLLPVFALLAASCMPAFCAQTRDGEAVEPTLPAESFPLTAVRLLDGPFKHAQEVDRRYLLSLDPNRLLAPFRTEAGLPPKAQRYPNWESTGLDGHTAGHYLSALAEMWASTGDAELKQRLDAMVSELAECQHASPDGFVGGIPNSKKLREEFAAAAASGKDVDLRGWWVPWYNEHKLFAGLRDAYGIAGNAQARDVLIRLSDWCDSLLHGLTDAQVQHMLGIEHGGMNEVLADVYSITGDAKYLKLARRFSHRAILDPLVKHEDKLTGLHANTQIPKVIGFDRIAQLGGEAAWHDGAKFFWNDVVDRRSLVFGGNSDREHFNPPDDFSAVIESREGPETCNTYNMLRLTELLFRDEPSSRYADFYERALFNHILSSQHPEHGGFVYFTPIRPQQYRVYSQPQECFWCCVGTGMENHSKYGVFIYAHSPKNNALFVNLFIASTLDWPSRGVRVEQDTRFPDEPQTRMKISAKEPQVFTLNVRHPDWCERPVLSINGAPAADVTEHAGYFQIKRTWHDGDRVELSLPMRTTLERLPDGSDYVAVLHGPIVLAAKTGTQNLDGLVAGDARMGHIAPGPLLPLDHAPMLVGKYEELAAQIQPVPGKPLTFTARPLIQPASFRELELEPFYRVHDARYMIYWRTVSADNYPQLVRDIEASEREALALESRTIDRIEPGEQQPEVEHAFQSEDSRSGIRGSRHWRDSAKWFSYDLNTRGHTACELVVTYDNREKNRSFELTVNSAVVAPGATRVDPVTHLVDVTYPLSGDTIAHAPNGLLTVKFSASPSSRTPSIYGVRLVKSAASARSAL